LSTPDHRPVSGRPLVYAHRGGAALRPENTIPAFDYGLAMGADGLELDVHLSRDGIVVVHHDDTLERTTHAKGPLCDYTADELARVDAGYWFTPNHALPSPDYPFRGEGIGVPTLGSVLRRYRDVRLIIELKANDRELAQRTIDEIRAADALERVAIGSFYWRALHAARRYEPRVLTGAAREETRWVLYRSYVRWPLGRTPFRELQVPESSGSTIIVSPRFIAHAHRAGLPVKVWTINEEQDMRRLLDWGADALISDRPDLAVRVVQERYPS
jgi:glycerophosphoryl diester phosphodiesterase